MSAVPKIVFIYINHLYVSTAVFLMIPSLYTVHNKGGAGQDWTTHTKTEMMKCSKVSGAGGGGVYLTGAGGLQPV